MTGEKSGRGGQINMTIGKGERNAWPEAGAIQEHSNTAAGFQGTEEIECGQWIFSDPQSIGVPAAAPGLVPGRDDRGFFRQARSGGFKLQALQRDEA
ncbi:hypothetical protein BH09VER1_BH09VER1_29380 [soil metagenome]